tara:strand:+ start:57 stop:260 length:204 start_codon:yes stop_codon:yes gene_type:complete
MKSGDIVRISPSAPEDWLPYYREYCFEVRDVFERHCVVKMLGGNNPERYIFTEKGHFVPAKKENSNA